MALPAGLATKTLTFGRYGTGLGNPRGGKGTVGFERPAVWSPTGEVIVAEQEPFAIAADTGTFALTVPVCDDPRLLFFTDTPGSALLYTRLRLELAIPGYRSGTFYVYITADMPQVIDFDTLAQFSTGAGQVVSVPVVTSVRLPNGTSQTGDVVLGELTSLEPATRVPADSLRTWGHSFVSGVGVGVTAGTDDFATILAESLGLPLRNEAIGGTTLTAYTGGGASWPNVLQKVTRPPRFSSPRGCHVSMYGINDLAFLGNTPALLAPFVMAQRVVVSRLRAGRIFEDNDTTVVLGGAGAWNPLAGTAANSGSQASYNTTAGATIAITTPADFPGGTIALGFISWTDGGGATISGTVNGQTHSINTAATSLTSSRDASVLRIPNVPAGAATYTFTTSAIVGGVGCIFDYWQWEPVEADCPYVFLIKQPKPVDYTAYGAGAPTDAGVDVINAAFDTIAAEFGARVVTVDTSAMDHSTTHFVAGNVHPTQAGHRVLASIIRAKIASLITPTVAPQTKAPRVEYGTAAPTGASTMWYRGDQVVNTTPAPGTPPGWICTAGGAPGAWTELAPVRVGSGQVALVGGTVTVANGAITNGTTQIRVWTVIVAGTPGAPYVSAKTSGTSFTISSTSAADASVVAYEILTY